MWCWCVDRLVHAGQRLEWQQRVQGGAQLQPESAPAMLQVKGHRAGTSSLKLAAVLMSCRLRCHDMPTACKQHFVQSRI